MSLLSYLALLLANYYRFYHYYWLICILNVVLTRLTTIAKNKGINPPPPLPERTLRGVKHAPDPSTTINKNCSRLSGGIRDKVQPKSRPGISYLAKHKLLMNLSKNNDVCYFLQTTKKCKENYSHDKLHKSSFS